MFISAKGKKLKSTQTAIRRELVKTRYLHTWTAVQPRPKANVCVLIHKVPQVHHEVK